MENNNQILAVLVIHNINIYESITFNTLIRYKEFYNAEIEVIIVDNSEVKTNISINETEIKYFYNGNVNKLSGAYNIALSLANDLEIDWLLLLDQDTELTKEYFISLNSFVKSNFNSEINAVVPFLWSNNKLISPQKLIFNYWVKKRIKSQGQISGFVVALNSMSLLKVDFLNSISGFSESYTLDMLDYWLYLQLYKKERKVYLLNCDMNHNLSVDSYQNSISLGRHKDLLIAEKNFSKEMGVIYFFMYKVRLFFRYFKHLILIDDKRYSGLTLKSLFDLI